MRFRLEPLTRKPTLNFYLGLAFFFWSILPHFHFLTHIHKGGTGSHAHRTFSKNELALANQTTELLGAATLASLENTEFGAEAETKPRLENEIRSSLATLGEVALKPSPANNQSHGHYWEDANLAGIGSLAQIELVAIVPVSYLQKLLVNPFSEITGLSLARGPPSFAST